VFGLPHLSEDAVAAFADGVLSAAAASRARRHCAECVECADAVRGQRETAMMLRAAQAPALPSGLLDRLAGLPMSTPLPRSHGGLPTVLGADGTAMFVAHDVHKASQAPSEDQSGGTAHTTARPSHRRGALPVTVLASAAAVVAAGTFGGHVSTLAAAADQQAPANVAGSLTGGQPAVAGSASPLTSSGALLRVDQPSARGVDQAARPGLLPGSRLATSLILAPVRRVAEHPNAAGSAGNALWSVRPAGSSAAGSSAAGSTRPAARPAGKRPAAGFASTTAGPPAATP
jgi:hypothetical protein